MMKQRIYKDENAPGRWGVQAIVYEHHEVGWSMITNGDYYLEFIDRFVAVDGIGMTEQVVNNLENIRAIYAGRTISNAEYQSIYQQAKSDKNFANKTGYLPGERRAK